MSQGRQPVHYQGCPCGLCRYRSDAFGAPSGGGRQANKLLGVGANKDIVGRDAAWSSGGMVWIEDDEGDVLVRAAFAAIVLVLIKEAL